MKWCLRWFIPKRSLDQWFERKSPEKFKLHFFFFANLEVWYRLVMIIMQSVCICFPVCMAICVSVILWVCKCACPCVGVSVCQWISLSVCQCVSVSVCLCASKISWTWLLKVIEKLQLCMSLCVCVCVSLCLCVLVSIFSCVCVYVNFFLSIFFEEEKHTSKKHFKTT